MFCTNCGKEIPEGSAFCTGCGQPVSISDVRPAVPVSDTPEAGTLSGCHDAAGNKKAKKDTLCTKRAALICVALYVLSAAVGFIANRTGIFLIACVLLILIIVMAVKSLVCALGRKPRANSGSDYKSALKIYSLTLLATGLFLAAAYLNRNGDGILSMPASVFDEYTAESLNGDISALLSSDTADPDDIYAALEDYFRLNRYEKDDVTDFEKLKSRFSSSVREEFCAEGIITPDNAEEYLDRLGRYRRFMEDSDIEACLRKCAWYTTSSRAESWLISRLYVPDSYELIEMNLSDSGTLSSNGDSVAVWRILYSAENRKGERIESEKSVYVEFIINVSSMTYTVVDVGEGSLTHTLISG